MENSPSLLNIAAEHNARAHWHLLGWAERIRSWAPNIGYPGRAAGLSTGGGSGDDSFEHLCEEADGYAARTCEAIIDNLPDPRHRSVLSHVYLASVWRFRNPVDELLREALDAFWARARGQGLS